MHSFHIFCGYVASALPEHIVVTYYISSPLTLDLHSTCVCLSIHSSLHHKTSVIDLIVCSFFSGRALRNSSWEQNALSSSRLKTACPFCWLENLEPHFLPFILSMFCAVLVTSCGPWCAVCLGDQQGTVLLIPWFSLQIPSLPWPVPHHSRISPLVRENPACNFTYTEPHEVIHTFDLLTIPISSKLKNWGSTQVRKRPDLESQKHPLGANGKKD